MAKGYATFPIYHLIWLYNMDEFSSIELCAGAGGQAIGVESAGFGDQALVEIDLHAAATLKLNRPHWNVIRGDLREFSAKSYQGIDLVCGGVPCPPFSKAGKQLGSGDERDLFPEALRVISECKPRFVMLENVRGLLDTVFDEYRKQICDKLRRMGYEVDLRLHNAADFGVPQLRPRVVIVGHQRSLSGFQWPVPQSSPRTVGETLEDLMAANHWRGAHAWALNANQIAPTVVGGSKKHGGADLGPTRARLAWLSLGVDGKGIADAAPEKNFVGIPRLTNRMVARIQGFPDSWEFSGGKTATYRQIGNAFPSPVPAAVAR